VSASTPAWVQLSGVSFSYGERGTLQGLDLELPRGELSVLLGPNGAGKSTLLGILAGVLRPQAGQVRVGGEDPAALSRAAAARRVVYLPSRAEAPVDYSALELVLMGRYPFGRGLLSDHAADVALARDALARVDALAFAERSAAALSSGERQRVLLARLLCQATPGAHDGAGLLLLDEPTSAQDLAHQLSLFALLRELAETDQRAVLVASHAMNAAARHAHRILVLKEGRLLSAGPPKEVLTQPLLREAFAVEALVAEAETSRGPATYVVPLEPLAQSMGAEGAHRSDAEA
jgi:ABC-type cobalamin/Fe3+-siderophores transport system ATPase subunit